MSDDPRTPAAMAPGGTPWAALRVGILGLNAWVVATLIPTVHVGVGSPLLTLLALAPLLALAVGLWALEPRPGVARGALLGAFAPAIGLTIAARPEMVTREAFDAPAMVLAAASLLGYLAVAAHAVTRPRLPRRASVHPLRSKEPVMEPPSRRWLRRTLLAVGSLGTLAVAVLAPASSDRAERAAAWSGAEDDGLVLTAVVAALVGAFAMAAIIGPGLRARRARAPQPSKDRRRLVATLAFALLTGAAALILEQLDAG